MCVYKLVRAEFAYFGLQGTIENTIKKSQRVSLHRIIFKIRILVFMSRFFGKFDSVNTDAIFAKSPPACFVDG